MRLSYHSTSQKKLAHSHHPRWWVLVIKTLNPVLLLLLHLLSHHQSCSHHQSHIILLSSSISHHLALMPSPHIFTLTLSHHLALMPSPLIFTLTSSLSHHHFHTLTHMFMACSRTAHVHFPRPCRRFELFIGCVSHRYPDRDQERSQRGHIVFPSPLSTFCAVHWDSHSHVHGVFTDCPCSFPSPLSTF